MRRRYWWVLAVLAVVVGAVGVPAAFAQSDSDDLAEIETGQSVFESNCASCHGADGTGSQAGRSLIGIALSEPDRLAHLASVSNGKGNMPAFGERLSADEIDVAISYARITFVDPAAQAEPADLAVTGSSSWLLAGIGALLLVSGIVLVTITTVGRRRFGAETPLG